jgi:hypothetical protein
LQYFGESCNKKACNKKLFAPLPFKFVRIILSSILL